MSTLYNLKRYLKQASPMIFCIIAAGGVVGTAILAAKGTPKAMRLLEEAEENGVELTTVEKAITVAPAYIPAAAVGVGTICCIFGANVLSTRQQASIAAAYGLLERTYHEYKDKVKDILGDAESEIETEIVKDHLEEVPFDGSVEKPLFYDTYGKRYFNATELEVRDAEYHLNRNYQLRGYASLDEFFAFLGLESVDGADVLGWSMDDLAADGYLWIDFEHELITTDDGLECHVIRYLIEPNVDPDLFPGIREQVERK